MNGNGHGLGPSCGCEGRAHASRFIVLTGGPGAGKTAVLESLKKSVCEHIALVPESASIVFGGGFWRHESVPGKKAAQRAIFHVQREMERIVREEGRSAIAVCDRGTVDGLAYWPGEPDAFFQELGTTREREMSRYDLVIHLRTPSAANGYNHANPMRVESAKEARDIDERILLAWDGHPRRILIESRPDFLEKTARVIELVRAALPECCRAIRS